MTAMLSAPSRRAVLSGRGAAGHRSVARGRGDGRWRTRGWADPEPAGREVAEQLDDAPGLVPPESSRAPPAGVPDPSVVVRASASAGGDGDDQPRARVI